MADDFEGYVYSAAAARHLVRRGFPEDSEELESTKKSGASSR